MALDGNPFATAPGVTASEVMTAEEVGALLRLRPSTVADLARRGELPSVKLGRARRYLRADVLAYLRAQRQAAST